MASIKYPNPFTDIYPGSYNDTVTTDSTDSTPLANTDRPTIVYVDKSAQELAETKIQLETQVQALLNEREEKMTGLQALAGMLYLHYKRLIQERLLEFEPTPEPKIISEVRALIDKNYHYYAGKSDIEYCLTFERIVGNAKEKLLPDSD